jgi:hypothetical protein
MKIAHRRRTEIEEFLEALEQQFLLSREFVVLNFSCHQVGCLLKRKIRPSPAQEALGASSPE